MSKKSCSPNSNTRTRAYFLKYIIQKTYSHSQNLELQNLQKINKKERKKTTRNILIVRKSYSSIINIS